MPFGFGSVMISTDQIADGAITNVKVAAAAAIAESKINPNPGTHAAAAAPHSGHLIGSNGSYTGNNTVNKAVAHGLGRVPKAVTINRKDANGTAWGRIIESGFIIGLDTVGAERNAVTAWDATNFYVQVGIYGLNVNLADYVFEAVG
jgi:hypothetical protein